MADDAGATPPNRLERRKQRTRVALIRAAQSFIAAGQTSVPILDITQAADVGMGSFYNHFATKEELFAAAVADVLDTQGALLDVLTASVADPAEAFACRFRVVGRMFRHRPTESRILLRSGLSLLSSDRGLAPRALRDIGAAADAGRFTVRDPAVALAVAGGALMGLGQLLLDDPDRDDATTTDEFTRDVLRLFGMSVDEARRLCSLPLPDLAALDGGEPGSAARPTRPSDSPGVA